MSPKTTLCAPWVRLCICHSLVILSQATTVSFFENCGVTLRVRAGEKFTLKINGSQFISGDASCRVAFKGISTEDGSGLVDCHTVGMSKVGRGVHITVVTLGPETTKTYNFNQTINIDEDFESAIQYILLVTKTELIYPVLINVTLEVSQLGQVDYMEPLLTATFVIIFVGCILLFFVKICKIYDLSSQLSDCLYQSPLPQLFCPGLRSDGAERNDSGESGEAEPESRFTSMSEHLSLDVSRLSSDHEQSHLRGRDAPPSYESCVTSQPPDVIANAPPYDTTGISDDVLRNYHQVLYNISSLTSSDLSGDTDDGLPTYNAYIDSQAPIDDANMTSTPRLDEENTH